MSTISNVRHLHDSSRQPARGQVACSQCSLGELCLPRGLSDEEKMRFEQIVQRSRPIQPGEYIFRTGDDFRSVATVRTGCFKSYVIDRDGQEQVLGFHLPGELIGLDAIHAGRHMASVVALDTSAICSLGFDAVTGMARHMPELQDELFRVMSQRIAMFLLSLSHRFARRDNSDKEFILSMSRRDIASYLRLATETVSRVLARFQKRGLIDVDRKQVRLLDTKGLHKLTE
jgi:CRP/FNR family transcriptional regulator